MITIDGAHMTMLGQNFDEYILPDIKIGILKAVSTIPL